MIELEELDHVLSLSRDRLAAGRADEAADHIEQLIEALAPDWHWPAARRAQHAIRTGGTVDWNSTREEFMLGINATIVAALNRRDAEKRGSEKGVKQRQRNAGFASDDMLDEVRSIHDPAKSAEWHRKRLAARGLTAPGLRTVQRYLQKIRSTQI